MTMSLDPFESMLQLEMPQLPPSYQGVQPMIQMPQDMPQGMDPSMGGMPQVPGMPAPGVAQFLQQLESQGAFEETKAEPKKGMQAHGQTVKEEVGGLSSRDRAEMVARDATADMADAQVDIDRRRQQADEMERQAAKIREDVARETEARHVQEAENAKRQETLRSQQMELSKQNDEPINPNRYFENMSIFAKGAALLSAGVSGYFRPGAGAPIVEELMQMARSDVQAQLADRQSNQAKRSALIEQYERQYGDTTLVAKRLEADKLLTLAKAAKAEGLSAQTADGRAIADDMEKKLLNNVGRIHNEIQQATAQKPIEVTTTYGLPKPTGGGDPNKKLKEALELDKLLEQRGYTREERAGMLQAAKLSPPGGKTEAEYKREEDARKAAELPPEQQKDLRERVDGLAAARNEMRSIEAEAKISKVGGKAYYEEGTPLIPKTVVGGMAKGVQNAIENTAGSLPWGLGDAANNTVREYETQDIKALRRRIDAVATAMGKSEGQGNLTEADKKSYQNRLPLGDSQGFLRGTQEVLNKQRQTYRNLAAQYGKDLVDQILQERKIDPTDFLGGE